MTRILLLVGCTLSLVAPLSAEAAIEGASAPRWQACTGWTTTPPARYGVTNENGALVFAAEGANTELPWLLRLEGHGVTGDEHYLLLRYRATGMVATRGNYFVHGQEGTVGGRAYALADQLKPDGERHTLAVDLVALEPAELTQGVALKVIVDDGGKARLTVERLWFADELPKGAEIAELAFRTADKTVSVDWQAAGEAAAQAGWTLTPAADFSATPEGTAEVFTVRNAGKGMRWLLTLPEPVDLTATPYLSTRYQASGQLGNTTYALWLGDKQSGTGGNSTVPVSAGDLTADGAWHNLCLKGAKPFTATHLAVGLDCAGGEATLKLDTIRFSSRARRWALEEVLPHERRDAPWEAGKDRFAATAVVVSGGGPSAFFLQRLGLTDWFTAPHVTVQGVPFEVSTDLARVPQSGLGNFGALSMKLPPGCREVFLLTANSAPPTEPWGIDWQHPKPVERLDVPEKVYYEIRYASGPPDRVLPLDAETGQWGMKRGLSVNIVHPDPTRQATELVLHDRMQTASFAVVGATTRKEAPRLAEPTWRSLAAGLAPVVSPPKLPAAQPVAAGVAGVTAGALQARFDTQRGLSWSQVDLPGLPGALSCAAGPVFEVVVGGKALPTEDWAVTATEALDAGRRFLLRNSAADLSATVECVPGGANGLLLRMRLTNEGATATTATLRFPVLRGVCLGSAAETWYLFGKRGGLLNCANLALREPLGERHPLQMDGFFNPKQGVTLACLTHDTAAQHHFLNLAKTDAGGEWSPEYVERDLAPGATFTATEAALGAGSGDWRTLLGGYTDWLKTWFKPVAPRKPWFERLFALASGNAHYDMSPDAKVRGALQPQIDTMRKYLGLCDYVHLFGWSASKTYGDWGDYDHYDETVGGKDYFRDNIRRVQEKGIAVSLYLDGYLSSSKGEVAGAHAEEWAMKNADGSPQYVKEYDSYNECPYEKGWQDHLSEGYRRVHQELNTKILYIDEYGATDGRWKCQAKDHGHNGYEIPYAGEVAMLKRIREAVGPDVALYTEYPPAEVSRRYLDGSLTYQALWSADQEPLAPHFIDLPRFAFPDFKQFHILYYVGNRAGNWWLLKYPFFNGEVYRTGVPNLPGMDEPSLAFLKRAVEIQCAHRDAFASRDVEPLVPTEVPGVFANRFSTPKETVWTLYNANGRSVSTPVLRVKHLGGATYEDAWRGTAVVPKVEAGQAVVSVELEPKGVGCVVQRRR
ncbi:MAG: hypothetical protein GW911_10185 [Armatimonadetes bacterium]|nr:hypothetical protein [Armatimonadota bacterium]NCO92815.1 hypothetical protein [Armatimonadota bacterium]NDK12407.1 hypothetical protein [Armatimonadota bacterium]